MAFTEDLIARARRRINFKLDDASAWELASRICDAHDALRRERGEKGLTWDENFSLVATNGGPDARGWLRALGESHSMEDQSRVAQWVERVYTQRFRLGAVQSIVALDDPLAGSGPTRSGSEQAQPASGVHSVRSAAGKTPLHSEITADYFAAKKRSGNYKRALEQFREQCGDLEVHQYTAEHCWSFRNWLNEALDEKKGERLAGQTKNHKLAAARSLFDFAIEKRHRNDNRARIPSLAKDCSGIASTSHPLASVPFRLSTTLCMAPFGV